MDKLEKIKEKVRKKLDQMNGQELTVYWNKRISRLLLGKQIIKVEYMSGKMAKALGWYKRPIQIGLSDGTWLTPQSDDEGNDGGALTTNLKDDPVIPVL